MGWTTKRTVSELPDKIAKEFRAEASGLLRELEENKLCIGLIPAPEQKHSSHMIRVVMRSNPSWYSELYWDYNNFRRDRSINALKRIREGRDGDFFGKKGAVSSYFKYDSIYREFILQRLANGYVAEDWLEIPPSRKVKKLLEEIVN